ncbi:Uncharacterised protein [Vibrio cholerae]|nr:Uncharacterised protein [Vibrio cholerae]
MLTLLWSQSAYDTARFNDVLLIELFHFVGFCVALNRDFIEDLGKLITNICR